MRWSVRPAQYLALVLYLLFLGFPLLWLISASVKSSGELNSLTVSLLPGEWHWDNYGDALSRQGLLHSALNSLLVALASTVLAILPLFLVLRSLGLADSLVGLTLVHTTYILPFALWMLQGYVAAIPIELEEAAATDGANRFTVLRRIVFPLLAPGVVATAMFSFVSSWNEFFFALVLLQSPENYTLPITLTMFIGGEGKVALGPLAAGAVLAAIPSIAFFSLLRKKLTSGLMAGAVKG